MRLERFQVSSDKRKRQEIKVAEDFLDGNLTINSFLEKLGSKEAVPGGGGAAALSASIGISLCKMAANLTVGKKKYADVEERMYEIISECDKLKEEFIILIQKDAEGFLPLSKAYGLPAETEEQKKFKEETLERELVAAAAVPFEIMEKCAEAIALCAEVAEKGSRLVVSDAACAVNTCNSALKCASLNVYINTKYMKDTVKACEMNRKADSIIAGCDEIAENVFNKVVESLKGK
ncbi:MAG: cyclodeaminase/cyclohydrolase family protein [Lachnospiraceae bacterium]|nr:cyclodeaminase/cyclohydrolase family protein [Lachnospiraceae bacterium]